MKLGYQMRSLMGWFFLMLAFNAMPDGRVRHSLGHAICKMAQIQRLEDKKL